MTQPIQLRPAVATDLNAVLALERATQNAPHWPLSSYAAILETRGQTSEAGERSYMAPQRCLLAAHSGTLLTGFAVGLITPAPSRPDAPSTAELESVVVASAARRAGLGRILCNAVLAWCRTRGATEIILEVRASSTGAVALYASLGFTRTALRHGYYRDPGDDAVLMRLPYPPSPKSPESEPANGVLGR
jgi:ribosomal-protein-alanine N-acetyltransferase